MNHRAISITNGEHASTNVSRALLNRSTVGFGLFGPVTFRRRERGKRRESSLSDARAPSLSGTCVAPSLNFPLFLGPRVPPPVSLPLSLFQAVPASLVLSHPDSRSSLSRALLAERCVCAPLKHEALEFRFFEFPWESSEFSGYALGEFRGEADTCPVPWKREESHHRDTLPRYENLKDLHP